MDVIFTHETALDLYRLGLDGVDLKQRETEAVIGRLRGDRDDQLAGGRLRSSARRGWADVRDAIIGDPPAGLSYWSRTSLAPGAQMVTATVARALLPELPILHVLVPSDCRRHNTQGVVDHIVSGPLPAGSLRRIGTGFRFEREHPRVYVTSPELTFLQLASTVGGDASRSLPLLTLGFELCGYYRRYPCSLASPQARGPVATLALSPQARGAIATSARGGFRQVDLPLTTPEDIKGYLDQVGRAGGRPRGLAIARKAAEHIAMGAASPMEAVVTLLLCLPRRWGGYGLPLPELNGHLALSERARVLADRDREYVDLLWRAQGVALEYDSDAYHIHAGPRQILSDKHRVNAASDMCVRVVSLTRDQLYSPVALDAIARSVRASLCIRLRPASEEMRARRMQLRRALLGPSSV